MIVPRNASAGTSAHHTPLSAAKEIEGSQYPRKSGNWSKTQVTRMYMPAAVQTMYPIFFTLRR